MANIREWETEIKGMKKEDAREMFFAISSLLKWEMFKNEFHKPSLKIIRTLLGDKVG